MVHPSTDNAQAVAYSMNHLEATIGRFSLPFEPAPLQKEDALMAANCGRFGFFYAVGGGKTFVSTLCAKIWNDSTTIITCPPILLDQWEEWLHSVNETDTSIFKGPKRTEALLKGRWIIMSHAIFRDSYDKIEAYFRHKEVTLVIDEAQAIKNPRSVLYKNVVKFVGVERHLLLLTATPTSKPEDTYTYMKLKTPPLYRSYGHWTNLHVGAVDNWGGIQSYKNIDLLKKNFALNSVKRTKLDLFGHNLDPIYQPIRYELSKKHYKLYCDLAEEQLLLLPDGTKIDATTAQKLRHKLQQIVLDLEKFSGVEGKMAAGFELLDQVLEEVDPMVLTNSKLCIWTYYKASSKLVYDYLRKKLGDKAVAAAYSETDSRESVRRIMHDPECRVLVGQPTSVGVGLNLHHVCSEMLFLEQATVPMYARQAIGRVDRAGQKIRPTIRFALASGTVQVKLFNDLLKNDDLTSKVEGTAQSLRDEIFGK